MIWGTETGNISRDELKILDAALINYSIGTHNGGLAYLETAAKLLAQLNPDTLTENSRDIYNLIVPQLKERGYLQE